MRTAPNGYVNIGVIFVLLVFAALAIGFFRAV